MEFESYLNFLRNLLADEEDVAVLNSLQSSLKQNSYYLDEIIINKSRINQINRKEKEQVLSNSECSIEGLKIRKSILELISDLSEEDLVLPNFKLSKSIIGANSNSNINSKNSEVFTDNIDWTKLQKIGRWEYDSQSSTIIGGGIHQYLLSRNNYGQNDFSIICDLTFENYSRFSNNGIDNANAGIILGWNDPNNKPKYLNLLFSGEKIFLEGIGLYDGDAYRDFIHFDSGSLFEIRDNNKYEIVIYCRDLKLDLFINGEIAYSIQLPDGVNGRVGLRPWRSKLRCEYFKVYEI